MNFKRQLKRAKFSWHDKPHIQRLRFNNQTFFGSLCRVALSTVAWINTFWPLIKVTDFFELQLLVPIVVAVDFFVCISKTMMVVAVLTNVSQCINVYVELHTICTYRWLHFFLNIMERVCYVYFDHMSAVEFAWTLHSNINDSLNYFEMCGCLFSLYIFHSFNCCLFLSFLWCCMFVHFCLCRLFYLLKKNSGQRITHRIWAGSVEVIIHRTRAGSVEVIIHRTGVCSVEVGW